jgi:hypothetical protein
MVDAPGNFFVTGDAVKVRLNLKLVLYKLDCG